jgi:hypothetical protein
MPPARHTIPPIHNSCVVISLSQHGVRTLSSTTSRSAALRYSFLRCHILPTIRHVLRRGTIRSSLWPRNCVLSLGFSSRKTRLCWTRSQASHRPWRRARRGSSHSRFLYRARSRPYHHHHHHHHTHTHHHHHHHHHNHHHHPPPPSPSAMSFHHSPINLLDDPTNTNKDGAVLRYPGGPTSIAIVNWVKQNRFPAVVELTHEVAFDLKKEFPELFIAALIIRKVGE